MAKYLKLTRVIDLSLMTNSEEILHRYLDQVELGMKDIFIWTIDQTVITDMTKWSEKRGHFFTAELTIRHLSPFILD